MPHANDTSKLRQDQLRRRLVRAAVLTAAVFIILMMLALTSGARHGLVGSAKAATCPCPSSGDGSDPNCWNVFQTLGGCMMCMTPCQPGDLGGTHYCMSGFSSWTTDAGTYCYWASR